MNNIDFTQVITAEDKLAGELAAARDAARAECRRRIVAVCNETAQINLAAAVVNGALSGDDLATYRAVTAWIADMRAAWRPLAETGRAPGDDANWPAAPPGAAGLAARF